MDEIPKNLWNAYSGKYQDHVTISTIDSTIKSENVDERVVYIEDLEKRKQAYGICGEFIKKQHDYLEKKNYLGKSSSNTKSSRNGEKERETSVETVQKYKEKSSDEYRDNQKNNRHRAYKDR
ncbi:hypothetical protein RhiirA5_433349 [Rhizophagus irregularis]|uniref:Uncharacterized protein n=1 Tax=Rhizophagus irregularis TaxID=588596 RepID=A0A2N0NRZ4_9GLOM|nr:hypothetical protein RhiirA5_433349 [Rhizophagus irregularis]